MTLQYNSIISRLHVGMWTWMNPTYFDQNWRQDATQEYYTAVTGESIPETCWPTHTFNAPMHLSLYIFLTQRAPTLYTLYLTRTQGCSNRLARPP